MEKDFYGMVRLWRERGAEARSSPDWATSEATVRNNRKTAWRADEEEILPGSIVKLALREGNRINVFVTNHASSGLLHLRSEWQRRLCSVLVDFCLDGGTKVNSSAVIQQTQNGLFFLRLEVNSNRTLVRNVLEGREIGFMVRIKGNKDGVVTKHFAISLRSKRVRRTSWDSEGSILFESTDFPDYEQHTCCGNCWSGCTPVAMAQIFGYFDRIGSRITPRLSKRLYRDENTDAPLSMTDSVKPFVEDIRSRLGTFCSGGSGSTYGSATVQLEPWFKAHQGSKARVKSYLKKRTKRSLRSTSSRKLGGKDGDGVGYFNQVGLKYLKSGWPVMFSIYTKNNVGHDVVGTKYRQKIKRQRRWFLWWHYWKTVQENEFYLHYGWGKDSNKWQKISPFEVHVAYVTV